MAPDLQTASAQPTVAKSKSKKKKKSKTSPSKAVEENEQTNGVQDNTKSEEEDAEAQDEANSVPDTPTDDPQEGDRPLAVNSPIVQALADEPSHTSNGLNKSQWRENPLADEATFDSTSNTNERLDAALKDRDQLRNDVTELRKSLERLQQRQDKETDDIKAQLEESRAGKDYAENRYQKLLGQVNTIKAQLGERLKADAAELSSSREQIDGLENQNKILEENNQSLQSQISNLTSESENQTQEISRLRGRTNLSQQNWAKERDDLLSREAHAREEFENARQAMQDWEVLAMEERSVREGLGDRVVELEEQLSTQREFFDRASSERDSQSTTVDGLQRALQEVHEARKQERRELVENSEVQLEELRRQFRTAEDSSKSSQSLLLTAQQELERTTPFEKEVKEKNLLIGKLRHEAVILNDHLTKALKFLKKGKPEDNVDRQLVTNHFLHFLSLDRSDPKKFQILQLISALLGWTDEQKEGAGLSRPGGSNTTSSLRVPLSGTFRRVSSSSSANSLISPTFRSPSGTLGSMPEHGVSSPTSKEGLAELWSDFLEREAQAGDTRPTSSRRSSTAFSGMVSPTIQPGSPSIKGALVVSEKGSEK